MNESMAKRSNSAPGIRPGKKPGSFRIDYYDWDGTHRSKTFYGKFSDAVRLRRSLLTKVDRIKNGLEAPPEELKGPKRFSDLWDMFYEDYLLKVKSGSIEKASIDRHQCSMNALFDYNASLANKTLERLTWKDFEEYKIHRQSEGYSPHGINTNIRSFRTLFNYAVNKGFLVKSPLKDVPYIRTSKSDVRYLDENELIQINQVLENIDSSSRWQKDSHDLVIFYLYTGARAREALYPHFTWDCINDDRIKFPKTKTKITRTIPLTERVQSVLKSRKEIEGGPFHFDIFQVYKRTKSILTEAGIEDASTQTLRKTAGAYYYITTRDIFATSKFLGHSSVKVTESHYVGLIQSLQSKYSNDFDKLLSNRLNGRTLYVRY